MKFSHVVRSTVSAVALLGFTVAAQAQDEPPKFNGIYAGLHSGYAFGDESWSQRFAAAGPTSQNFKLDGGLAGMTAGYNWNTGSFVLGFELDASTVGLKDSKPCGFMGATCEVAIEAMMTARARAGLVFGATDQFMAYATGGAAVAMMGVTNPALPGANGFSDVTYVVGGGLEAYLMDSNWMSTKIEYLYVGLDTSKTYGIGPGVARLKFDGMHAVRWGWNLHF